jgi:uncharacterized membrane protein
MQSNTFHLRIVLYALLGIYVLLYPGSITLVALDRVPVWGTWMGGALLILQGTLMAAWLTINFGRWGLNAALLILLLSWAVEHLGATTGFPFGSYTYTDVLQPQIFGVVPLAIPFAWLLIVPAALGAGELLFARDRGDVAGAARVSLTKVMMAASFALLLDVTIEPFAVNINRYWVWGDASGSTYYGIPMSNFVAWWVTSLLLSWVLLWQRSAAARAVRYGPVAAGRAAVWPWLPLALYLSNLTMFVVVNLARGQASAALIGTAIMLVLAGAWLLPRAVRRIRQASEEAGA